MPWSLQIPGDHERRWPETVLLHRLEAPDDGVLMRLMILMSYEAPLHLYYRHALEDQPKLAETIGLDCAITRNGTLIRVERAWA